MTQNIPYSSHKTRRMNSVQPALRLSSPAEQQALCNFSPMLSPMLHVAQSMSQSGSVPTFHLSVAALLQSRREEIMQRVYYNSIARGSQALGGLTSKPSFGTSKTDKPRVIKARTMYRKSKIELIQRQNATKNKGPLPPPPTLVSFKDWQRIKHQLNPAN